MIGNQRFGSKFSNDAPGSTQAQPNGQSNAGPNTRPTWMRFQKIDELPSDPTRSVIEGLLRVGEKLGLTAGSKNYKSWTIAYLAFCLANGIQILGFNTVKCRVAIVDFELKGHSIRRRLTEIQKKFGYGDTKTNIEICAFRGRAREFRKPSNFKHLINLMLEGKIDVVIIDPIYKLLIGKNESATDGVGETLEQLTEFCEGADVSVIYAHHHSKGNQAAKNALDRGSGTGLFGRDADCLIDLVEHKESTNQNPIFTVEITLRDFAPMDKFVVRWNFPIYERDRNGLDPNDLKMPECRGGRKIRSEELIIAALRTAEGVANLPGLTVEELRRATGIKTAKTIENACKRLAPLRVVRSAAANCWMLAPGFVF